MDGDEKLLQQLSVGCPEAMSQLIEAYGSRLRRTIGHLTAWSPDVDDLLQETLVRAWRNASSFRAEGTLDRWLVSIAFRVCRDHQRGMKRVWDRLNRFWMDKRFREGLPPGTTENERWDALQSAIAKLPPEDRQLLVLRYLEEWSFEDLASQLELSIETLHVRLHRAKKRLQKLVLPNETE